MKFNTIPHIPRFPEMEQRILQQWKTTDLYDKVQKKHRERNDPIYTFLEGPPTANGLPHIGHALTRAIKDVFLRYKTMTGHYVSPRIGGWDCHGLPVEIEVEKELGLNSKKEIEEYGIAGFNAKCKESVFRYVKEWENMSIRIGFQLNMENSYVTMTNNYIESVWWSLQQAYKKNLLFKGHKVVPYCPRCGTPLSSHEVAQGYAETEDPSIFITFHLKEKNQYLLTWTTTPWTLLANQLLAVESGAEYAVVKIDDKELILAKDLVSKVLGDDIEIIDSIQGRELQGLRYEPLFSHRQLDENSHFITSADFVSLEEGTGIVHCAPAFGIEDYDLCQELNVPLYNPVEEDGTFKENVPIFGSMFVKDADNHIIKELERQGKLLRVETITHIYPFCWRCEKPLLYYAIETWFIGMSRLRDLTVNLNSQIRWKPAHLKEGRFGNFLDGIKDWALSRSRFWGTPLPIWQCPNDHEVCVGSVDDLRKLSKLELNADFDLHKPFIDDVKLNCPECNEIMKREPYVIDCWYDSGSATFAQWHYPFENKEQFEQHFPTDFITEAIDQTRGWFYSLHAIATFAFEKPAFKRVLSVGHVKDKYGKKMSKSRGNVISSEEMISKYGADAVRWYLFSIPAWNDFKFDPNLLEENLRGFLLPLWNIYSFFVTYARLDDYDPTSMEMRPKEDSIPQLDKWLYSALNSTLERTRQALEDLEVHKATKTFREFVSEDLSNWWVRRSRRRFWEKNWTDDKRSAYTTLYETLVTLSKALAPLMPFFPEEMHRNLVRNFFPEGPESIHLEDYPQVDSTKILPSIEQEFSLLREAIVAGRSARARVDIKNRQPLQMAAIVGSKELNTALRRNMDQVLSELNVKELVLDDDLSELQQYQLVPQWDKLGPKFKKKAREIADALTKLPSREVMLVSKAFSNGEEYSVSLTIGTVQINSEDTEILIKEKEGFTSCEFSSGTVFLKTDLTIDLIEEGYAREFIRRVQSMRKDMDLEYDSLIKVYVTCQAEFQDILEKNSNLIREETLTKTLEYPQEPFGSFKKDWDVLGADNVRHSFSVGIVPEIVI